MGSVGQLASESAPSRAREWARVSSGLMSESRLMIACPVSGTYWSASSAPSCTDASHNHPAFDLCIHRSTVVLPDGTPVVPVSFEPDSPYERDAPADFGVYLDERWQPPWPHRHVTWPDFGTPYDRAELDASLAALLARARAGQRVEIGCLGGHGRTGTALACLAVMTGVAADDAVAWVRRVCCARAIETPDQEAFVVARSVTS